MLSASIDWEEYTLPWEIEIVVKGLCADYRRRCAVIEARGASYKVIMEYRFLNYRIFNAAIEIVGEREALSFIEEIGNGDGYAKSNSHLSESVYKKRKKEVKFNIAKRLLLYE